MTTETMVNRNAKILIAEDDFEDRLMLSQTFSELGFEELIGFAIDGIYLIDHLEENVDAVKLIVLDLNMPRLNGTETLRKLKSEARFQQIPVIIFSTSINDIEKNNCLDLGAIDYIVKPGRYMEYINTCKYFCDLAQKQ
jgi:CheY-like chemotaxis protein